MRRALLLCVLALSACGSSPKTHFYTLDATPAVAPAHGSSTAPLQVGHVDLPGTLDRLSMVTHGSGDQVEVSDQDRWAAPLDELVRRALTADLRQRLPTGSVLAPGDPTPAGTRTLMVNVQQFMANPTGDVALDADWTLQRTGDKAARARHETIRVRMNGQGGEAVADAMDRALGQLADRIAAAS